MAALSAGGAPAPSPLLLSLYEPSPCYVFKVDGPCVKAGGCCCCCLQACSQQG